LSLIIYSGVVMLEDIIASAYIESAEDRRRGDREDEVKAVRDYIRGARRTVVPNWNREKVDVINEVLRSFNLTEAEHLQFNTNWADLTRMPAITKALMALDISGADLVIARGRLGVPGSGSLLVIMDSRGRILSAAMSPPHVIHKMGVQDAVRSEMIHALERIGFSRG